MGTVGVGSGALGLYGFTCLLSELNKRGLPAAFENAVTIQVHVKKLATPGA